jgi:RepB DNA-primase from phage plasmid
MTDAKTPGRKIEAREYVGTAFEPSDRLAILIRNRRRGETVQRITTAGKVIDPSFQDWLHFKNDREGFDVYLGMNPLKPAARTRTKEDVLSIRHLYVDLDHDGAKSLVSIQQSNLVPRPNYVLSTSPDKFQVIWGVQEVAQEQAETLLRAMAREFGGDPAVTDSTRVLRIPGFTNKKYDEGFVVTAEQHSDRVHHAFDFKLRIDHVDSPYQPVRRSAARTVSTESRPMSHSEHDWAFAKRALARGTNPEEVIRKIAQFREGDKSNSLDYARRTVIKAQAELAGQSAIEKFAENDQTPAKEIEFEP